MKLNVSMEKKVKTSFFECIKLTKKVTNDDLSVQLILLPNCHYGNNV